MTPAEPTRVWRKTRRKAQRGVKTGRRTTHAPTPPVRSPWQGKTTPEAVA